MNANDVMKSTCETIVVTLPVCGLKVKMREASVEEVFKIADEAKKEHPDMVGTLVESICSHFICCVDSQIVIVNKPKKECSEMEMPVLEFGKKDFAALSAHLKGDESDDDDKS